MSHRFWHVLLAHFFFPFWADLYCRLFLLSLRLFYLYKYLFFFFVLCCFFWLCCFCFFNPHSAVNNPALQTNTDTGVGQNSGNTQASCIRAQQVRRSIARDRWIEMRAIMGSGSGGTPPPPPLLLVVQEIQGRRAIIIPYYSSTALCVLTIL